MRRLLTRGLAILAAGALLAAAKGPLGAAGEAPRGRHDPERAVHEPAHLSEVLGPAGARDVYGRRWRARDLEGRKVLVDLWATWCAPCLADLPTLRDLHRRNEASLVILGVSLDTMPRRDFVSWLARHDVTWPQLFDGRGYQGEIPHRLGVQSVPAFLLFDERGRLVEAGVGSTAVAAARLVATPAAR